MKEEGAQVGGNRGEGEGEEGMMEKRKGEEMW